MQLIEGKKYIVDITETSFNRCGRYCLYFRCVFIDDDNSLILNFSESLEDDSVFYNFFQSEKFDIFDLQ